MIKTPNSHLSQPHWNSNITELVFSFKTRSLVLKDNNPFEERKNISSHYIYSSDKFTSLSFWEPHSKT